MTGKLRVVEARGLPADWLNAWLAAIGVTVLLPDVKLSWTSESRPTARFWVDDPDDFFTRLDLALPDDESLASTAIAPRPPGAAGEMRRKVNLGTYRDRARMVRKSHDPSLAAALTDLVELDGGESVASGPFNPPVPKGVTLAERAISCAMLVEEKGLAARATLEGNASRQLGNGLGFDPRRLSAAAQKTDNFVDPVLELLTFVALSLFPVRGTGRKSPNQRCWVGRPTQPGAFKWSAWSVPLDKWGIDAMLDAPELFDGPRWESVPYKPSTASDPTRAYFGRAV